MNPLLVKTAIVKGVAPVVIATSMFVSGVNNVAVDINEYLNYFKEIVHQNEDGLEEEIQEIIERYEKFEEDYVRENIDYNLHDIQDSCDTDEEVKEYIEDIRSEAVERFVWDTDCVDNIPSRVIKKMRRELPKDTQERFKKLEILEHYELEKTIVRNYIEEFVK